MQCDVETTGLSTIQLMKVSPLIWSIWLKVNNYLPCFSIMSHIPLFLFHSIIEACTIIIAAMRKRTDSFLNRIYFSIGWIKDTYSILRSRWRDRWTRSSCYQSWAPFWNVPRPICRSLRGPKCPKCIWCPPCWCWRILSS